MNSMKLFKNINFKYLKENIKKSKGVLAFFLGIVPLINILYLIVIGMNLKSIELLEFNSISLITYIGLFIIPIVLAVSLFGFVFKSKSVDFVMSKPLSRKTIYLTNILGGILLITIFMLINSLIYIIFNLIFTSLIIPFGLVLDYFILFLVSYIFIFLVSSLAICLAGNLMGSIVIILILLCLVPLSKLINVYYDSVNKGTTYIKCANDTCKPDKYYCLKNENCIKHLNDLEYEINGEKSFNYTFTAPFYNIEYFGYSLKSIIKMLILSLIYYIMGYYVFIKRKMENNETSFKNIKMHYVIKAITLIPVSFICYLILKEVIGIGTIVSIFIILAYSCIYDLITRKEIYRFIHSSIISGITATIIVGLFGVYDIYLNNNNDLIIKELKEININNMVIKSKTKYNTNSSQVSGEELINKIIYDTLNNKREVKSLNYIKVKDKYNREFNIGVYLDKDTNNLVNEIKNMQNINYFKNFNYNKINYIGSNILPNKEIKNLIKNTMTNISNYSSDEDDYLIPVYTYLNHKYEKFYIKANQNKELDNYIINELNKQAIEFINSNEDAKFYTNSSDSTFSYVLSQNMDKFVKYLEKENKEITTNYFYIKSYDNYNLNILIGNKDKFYQEYENLEANLKDDAYYQKLKEYYNTTDEDLEDYDEY